MYVLNAELLSQDYVHATHGNFCAAETKGAARCVCRESVILRLLEVEARKGGQHGHSDRLVARLLSVGRFDVNERLDVASHFTVASVSLSTIYGCAWLMPNSVQLSWFVFFSWDVCSQSRARAESDLQSSAPPASSASSLGLAPTDNADDSAHQSGLADGLADNPGGDDDGDFDMVATYPLGDRRGADAKRSEHKDELSLAPVAAPAPVQASASDTAPAGRLHPTLNAVRTVLRRSSVRALCLDRPTER